MKLLHTSDWQIGKLFGQFEPDEAALLADARFGAVERLARLAVDQGVEMILVAGDVFDAQGMSDRTIHRLFHAMAGFTGPWVLIPGNHDAALAESVWTRAARLKTVPDHVTVCLRPEPVVLPSLGAVILPAPLTQRNTYVDSTEWFAAAETPPGLMRIGLAHGCVQGILAEGIDSTNPIAAGRAHEARLDYLALGDWHGTRQVDERTWYSGTPETDRFKANDSGQALLVEMAPGGPAPTVTPVRTGQYRWRDEALEIQVPSDLERALAQLGGYGTADVVQWQVSGHTDLDGFRRLRAGIEQARGKARVLEADLAALRLEPTVEDIDGLKVDGYLGDVLTELRLGLNGPDGLLARDALIMLAGVLETHAGEAKAEKSR